MKNFEQESPIEKLLHETVEKMDLAETQEKLAGCEANIHSSSQEKEVMEKELEEKTKDGFDESSLEKIKEKIALAENIIRDEGEMRNLLQGHLHELEKAA